MLTIKEKNVENFLNRLKENFEVFYTKGEKLPFKKYFFPPNEEIFTSRDKGSINTLNQTKKFVLFGLGYPELEALTQLDEIMSKPNDDYFYLKNRTLSLVIGVVKGEMDAAPGGDVVFQKLLGDKYRVWENTARGKNLVKKYKEFFEEDSGNEEVKPLSSKHPWSASMRKLLLDSEVLADAVENSRGHKIWDELAKKCLGCGICTYVCPLCHCFSMEDSVGLDDVCRRCRKWDACTLPGFSRIAGGHTFRPTIKERYYNWFYHKFVRAYKEYGKSQCVGCGRCKRFCPAGIDIQEVLTEIIKDYKK